MYNKPGIFCNTIFKGCQSLHPSSPAIFALVILLLTFSLLGYANSDSTKVWVGTWSTAPQLVEPGNMPPDPGLSNNTLRQVVRVSLGGACLRVRFSNEFR